MHGLAARMPDVTVAEAVRVGDVIDGIVAEAETAGADIIAMASHRRRGVRRLVRRSVARRLQLLREHIVKENEVLFPLADAVLDEQAQTALLRDFAEADATLGVTSMP